MVGVDSLNDYYEVGLKKSRLDLLLPFKNFQFKQCDISDKAALEKVFEACKPNVVVNLAAQAGVRYSLENPSAYIQSNIVGFFNILEACRHFPVEHLVYASSSSVYGSNQKVPFEESDPVDHPVSLYAATKKSNELMAYTYSRLYKIPATGLRFFTVYGPWGRPDMAYYKFTSDCFAGKKIRIYNNGDFDNDLYRDFTYIDDIVEGIVKIISFPPEEPTPYRIFNIGNNKPEKLMDFIAALEKCLSRSLGRTVVFDKAYEPMKQGDVPATYASIDLLQSAVGFRPKTRIDEGLQKFTDWYVEYYHIK